MKSKYYIRLLAGIGMASLLGGCSAAKALIAMHRSTSDFQTLASDPRVKYEAGAKPIARILAAHLDHAIKLVEAKQYGAFKKPVIVYVPATPERIGDFCVSPRVGGCVLNGRLFISPKKQNTPTRLPRVLAHELSHLHTEQILGMWTLQSHIPSWFQEGLAVYASSGGGAEGVTAQQAKQAILSGKAITPEASGGLFFRHTASYFGLKTHMYYKQAELFVAWLHRHSTPQFRLLILNIQGGATLGDAVQAAYGHDLPYEWREFTAALSRG